MKTMQNQREPPETNLKCQQLRLFVIPGIFRLRRNLRPFQESNWSIHWAKNEDQISLPILEPKTHLFCAGKVSAIPGEEVGNFCCCSSTFCCCFLCTISFWRSAICASCNSSATFSQSSRMDEFAEPIGASWSLGALLAGVSSLVPRFIPREFHSENSGFKIHFKSQRIASAKDHTFRWIICIKEFESKIDKKY